MAVVLVTTAVAHARGGSILFVDDDAQPGGDGQEWQTAFRHLQDAWTIAAKPANGITEIRVAQGIYKPDQTTTIPNGSGDRMATFQLTNGVALRGGFRGLPIGQGESPDDRDINKFLTILSGDLIGNDCPNFGNNRENSLHVVTGSGTDATASIDGFTITSGNADATSDEEGRCGGGLHVVQGSPLISKCRFVFNKAASFGGALFATTNSNLLVIDDCDFAYNNAETGGALAINGSTAVVSCRILQNNATFGGGASVEGNSNVIANCLFNANHASEQGGGLYGSGYAPLTNCTVVANTSKVSGAGIAIVSPYIANCIVWNNQPDGLFTGSVASAVYSDIQGGWQGDGSFNLNIDPRFSNPVGIDGVAGTLDDDFRLRAGSWCLNTGNQGLFPFWLTLNDLDGNPRFVGQIDRGSFEFQHHCDADVFQVGGNGLVDIEDLQYVIQQWGVVSSSADINHDNIVNIDDLVAVITAWGPCP